MSRKLNKFEQVSVSTCNWIDLSLIIINQREKQKNNEIDKARFDLLPRTKTIAKLRQSLTPTNSSNALRDLYKARARKSWYHCDTMTRGGLSVAMICATSLPNIFLRSTIVRKTSSRLDLDMVRQ